MKTKYKWRVTAVLACAVMLMTVSCGSKQEGPASVVDIYRNTAQAYIESGDYESAVKALEEGVAATGDDGLATLLEEARAAQEAEATEDPSQDETQPTEHDGNEDIGPEDTQPTESGNDGNEGEATDDGLTLPVDGENEAPDGETDIPGDDIQPPKEETSDITEPPENYQTLPPEEGTEPTVPGTPPEEPAQAVGQFDDFVGTWQDEYGYGIYLCVGYGDATKEHAYASFYSAYEFEVELEQGLPDGEVPSALGAVFPEVGSEPEYTLELYRYKWWIDAYIYRNDGSEEAIRFYPADMSLSPPENPYYVG